MYVCVCLRRRSSLRLFRFPRRRHFHLHRFGAFMCRDKFHGIAKRHLRVVPKANGHAVSPRGSCGLLLLLLPLPLGHSCHSRRYCCRYRCRRRRRSSRSSSSRCGPSCRSFSSPPSSGAGRDLLNCEKALASAKPAFVAAGSVAAGAECSKVGAFLRPCASSSHSLRP